MKESTSPLNPTFHQMCGAINTESRKFLSNFRDSFHNSMWLIREFQFIGVELAGIEPASKQGNHTLSTRLFQPLIFVLQQDLNHQPQPYPLIFAMQLRHCMTIPDLPAPLDQRTSEQQPLSDVSSLYLVVGLSQ